MLNREDRTNQFIIKEAIDVQYTSGMSLYQLVGRILKNQSAENQFVELNQGDPLL